MATTSAKPSRPPGHKTAYVFFVESCRAEHEAEHQGKAPTDFSKWTRDVLERWKTMSEEAKKPFQKLAREHRERQENDPEKCSNSWASLNHHGTKRKLQKDNNKPRRALPAFHFFFNDHREDVKAKNPEFSLGEVATVLGKMWIDARMEVKANYEGKAQEDQLRYQKEMAEFKRKHCSNDEDPSGSVLT